MAVSILPLLATSLLNLGQHTVKLELGGAFIFWIIPRVEKIISKPGMPRALLITLATKNRHLQILDHTLAPLHLEEDISGPCTFSASLLLLLLHVVFSFQ